MRIIFILFIVLNFYRTSLSSQDLGSCIKYFNEGEKLQGNSFPIIFIAKWNSQIGDDLEMRKFKIKESKTSVHDIGWTFKITNYNNEVGYYFLNSSEVVPIMMIDKDITVVIGEVMQRKCE